MTHRSSHWALIAAVSLVIAGCAGVAATPPGQPTGAPASAAPGTAAAGTAEPGTAAPESPAASTASSPAANALVVEALKADPPGRHEFRGQIFVRGNLWSDGLEAGFKQAAQDHGVNVEIGGPMTVDPSAQVAELESWIVQGVDCIMLTAAAPAALTPSINKAVAAGIPVVTMDSDAPESDRSVFVTGASSDALANAQIDSLARQMGEEGEWAFIIGQSTQVEKAYQLELMLARAAEKYPKMTYLGMQESNDDAQTAADQVQALILKHPNLKGVISNSGGGTLGVAQGIKAAGKAGDIKVTGLTFASLGKQYVEDGTMPEFFLWNVQEQAYFGTSLCKALVEGQDVSNGTPLKVWTDKELPAVLEESPIADGAVQAVQGPPLKIDASNVNDIVP